MIMATKTAQGAQATNQTKHKNCTPILVFRPFCLTQTSKE